MAESDKEQQDTATNEAGWPASLLNANHRRVLASTLRRVELAAWRLEDQLTREVSPELALTRFTNPPSAPQRAALLRLTQQVREAVMQLASDYCLDVAEDNLLSLIKAEFSLLFALAGHKLISSALQVMLATGFLGGYTTFSTMSWEGVQLARGGSTRNSLLYFGSNLVLGLCAASFGLVVGWWL